MELGLQDKVALVAAGSKGLGRATADAFAGEGARVAICARNEDALEAAASDMRERHGVDVLPIVADVATAAGCQTFVSRSFDHFGRIDVLVNNSGGPSPGSFDDVDDDAWHAAFQSTLMNVVRLIRLCLPHMRAQRAGRIINIESVSIKQPIPGLLLSNAIRPAVVGLSKTLAPELAPDNILINTVLPGSHDTDRLRELAEARAAKSGSHPTEELQQMAADIPVRRLGQAGELAALVVFLASQQAGFVTGTTFLADGGVYAGTA